MEKMTKGKARKFVENNIQIEDDKLYVGFTVNDYEFSGYIKCMPDHIWKVGYRILTDRKKVEIFSPGPLTLVSLGSAGFVTSEHGTLMEAREHMILAGIAAISRGGGIKGIVPALMRWLIWKRV